MDKSEFLLALGKSLSNLNDEEIRERVNFYAEMIDDLMEEGISETEAVARVKLDTDSSFKKRESYLVGGEACEEKKPKRRFSGWRRALIFLGAPIWISLGISAFAVIFSFFAGLWCIVGSFWAVFASLGIGGVGALVFGCAGCFTNSFLPSVFLMSVGLFAIGLSIFSFFGCRYLTKGAAWLTKGIFVLIRNCFDRRESGRI